MGVKLTEAFDEHHSLVFPVELTIRVYNGVVRVLIWFTAILYHVPNHIYGFDKHCICCVPGNKGIVCDHIRNDPGFLHFCEDSQGISHLAIPAVCTDNGILSDWLYMYIKQLHVAKLGARPLSFMKLSISLALAIICFRPYMESRAFRVVMSGEKPRLLNSRKARSVSTKSHGLIKSSTSTICTDQCVERVPFGCKPRSLHFLKHPRNLRTHPILPKHSEKRIPSNNIWGTSERLNIIKDLHHFNELTLVSVDLNQRIKSTDIWFTTRIPHLFKDLHRRFILPSLLKSRQQSRESKHIGPNPFTHHPTF
nr:hypothetical protein Ahy_B09g099698 isoform E [Ipomoea batatas]